MSGRARDTESYEPKYTDEMLEFLDELRESGVTNMFGARPYLMEAFPLLSKTDASDVLGYWMRTFPRSETTTVNPSKEGK